MKKIVLNISDSTYEKFRFEAIYQRKSVQEVIANAITQNSFTPEVEDAYNEWIEKNIVELMSN